MKDPWKYCQCGGEFKFWGGIGATCKVCGRIEIDGEFFGDYAMRYPCKECTNPCVDKLGETCDECLSYMVPTREDITLTISGGTGGSPVTIATPSGDMTWIWMSGGGVANVNTAPTGSSTGTGQIDLYLGQIDKPNDTSNFMTFEFPKCTGISANWDLASHHPACSNFNVHGTPYYGHDTLGRVLRPMMEIVECGCWKAE